ncbi:Pvc16 family protein [Kitasatospora sp. NPDC052896]|uniref:Pvc16 family protein n=1 Tax=Kitasatospora sp. NPDC052896 TaxID=3364061 RepID=UPI0037CBA8EB
MTRERWGVLRDADLSFASWLGSVLPPATGVRFDPPGAGWDGGSGTPFVSAFLHDVRRDGQSATAGWSEVRDSAGRLVGRQSAARYYRIRYLVTAWAEATLDEHGLLGLLLDACTLADTLADDHLTGALAEAGLPSFLRCADEEPGHSAQGLWPGLGIVPRAHLVLDLVAPVVPPMVTELAPPTREIALGARQLPGATRA